MEKTLYFLFVAVFSVPSLADMTEALLGGLGNIWENGIYIRETVEERPNFEENKFSIFGGREQASLFQGNMYPARESAIYCLSVPLFVHLSFSNKSFCYRFSVKISKEILGQVWYLIVSIPDLCNLTYFDF